MKNIDIHNGLDQKEVRDLISTTFRDCLESQVSLRKNEIKYDSENLLSWSIENEKQEIIYHQKLLENLKRQSATIEIMKMCEWEEFYSEETGVEEGRLFSLNFIGTKTEYQKFIKSIKNKNKNLK